MGPTHMALYLTFIMDHVFKNLANNMTGDAARAACQA